MTSPFFFFQVNTYFCMVNDRRLFILAANYWNRPIIRRRFNLRRFDLGLRIRGYFITQPAYMLYQAIQRVDWGAINVRNAVVVVDSLTSDTRGAKLRLSLTPEWLVWGLNQLLQTLRAAVAKTIVTWQVKPMLIKDVKPFNKQLSDYLRGQGWGSDVPT